MRWRLMPKEIGTHPANRDGAAMTAFAAQLRGARILESGFSSQAIGKVWCVEDPPRSRHIEKHTLNVTSSDSAFGSYEAGTVRVGPLNWTHSNQFVAMVMDRTPCDYAALPLRDGKLDSDTILQDPKNKILKEYIDSGMVCTVFPYWIEESYPLIPRIFQSAANQEQQVQEGESWQQVLKKIANRASEMPNSRADDIARAVLRSQPPHAEDVPGMIDQHLKWGGGKNGFWVNDLLRFCQVSKVSGVGCRVSGRAFAALANLKFEATEVIPARAVCAILKRMASSDRSCDGVSSIYKVADINSITSKQSRKKLFLKAHGLMEEASALLKENAATLQDHEITKAEGWLQMSLVDFVLEKPNIDGNTFDDMADIWKDFLLNTFQKTAPAPGKQSAESMPSAAVQYDQQGNAIGVPKAILQSKGIAVV